jgi:hypothetical protein
MEICAPKKPTASVRLQGRKAVRRFRRYRLRLRARVLSQGTLDQLQMTADRYLQPPDKWTPVSAKGIGDPAMLPAKPFLGCLVMLAASAGLVISNHVVDAVIPLKNARATKPADGETPATVRPQSPIDRPATGARPDDANAEGPISTGRVCTDLNGRTFGWNWPNIPFGAAACGDAGRKTGK